MAYVFSHLRKRYPGRYHLIINRHLHSLLQRAGFGLDLGPDIHILEGRSLADLKWRAESGALINAGRVLTLIRYRAQIRELVRQHGIGTLQVFLEMVPVLGLLPLKGVTSIASLVSHLPKYYDRRRFSCWMLLWALQRYHRVDALYESIASRLQALGIEPGKIHAPSKNCIDHERFRPGPKERLVSFTSRLFAFKNPFLMLDIAEEVLRRSRTCGSRSSDGDRCSPGYSTR
jgi:glycosyltransferase involved in cell wall biosynthesis